MIVTTRRGARPGEAISVAASASVGRHDGAEREGAGPREARIAECADHATPHVVAATRPIASSEIGRRFARRSRSPVKNAAE